MPPSSDSNKELYRQLSIARMGTGSDGTCSVSTRVSTGRGLTIGPYREHTSQTKTSLSWNETYDPRTTLKIVQSVRPASNTLDKSAI